MAESSHGSNGSYSKRKPYSRRNGNLKAPSKEDDKPPPQRDYLGNYFHELSDLRYSPIPQEEEVILAERASTGDESARNRLIESNLRYVVAVAMRYVNQGLSTMELISAGNIGLMIAAERFDTTRGFKFFTYADYWIRQRIEIELRERRNGKAISLDTILGETNHGQIPSPDPTPSDDVEREETYLLLQKALAELDERDRRILELYYCEGFKDPRIAKEMGVTPARINQLRNRAKIRLRTNLPI